MEHIWDPNVWSKFYVAYGGGLIRLFKFVDGEYQMGAKVGFSASSGKTITGPLKYKRLCAVNDSRAEDLIYVNREHFGLFYDGAKDPFGDNRKDPFNV